MRRLTTVLLTAAIAAAVLPAAASAAPGGVFITGHDPDFHALSGNTAGARHIIQRAVGYVTHDDPSPSVLLVTSRIAPPSGHVDSAAGMTAAGYTFDMAGAPGQGILDLTTVDFANYDVVVVASDFGGILRQDELDILNARSQALVDYVNDGGGLVALAESNFGQGLTPNGGHFDFLPFVASDTGLNQGEAGYTVTAFGQSLGLVDSDVNGNVSHNIFTSAGGFQTVDLDAQGRILSLAVRDVKVCPGGVPNMTVGDVEHHEGHEPQTTPFSFEVKLSISPCGATTTVKYETSSGTATSGTDFNSATGTLSFAEGETQKTVTVGVRGDSDFEPDETFTLRLFDVQNGVLLDGLGLGTILNDDVQNHPPSCATVSAAPAALWPPNHKLVAITLGGASDADGDAVALTITAVTQDEPVDGKADGNTSPDAAGIARNSVKIRAERAGTGDGRVYRIAFTGSDGKGGSCQGTATAGVPHDRRGSAAVDSGTSFDSLG